MNESLSAILPHQLRSILNALPQPIQQQMEEIRVREQRPLEIVYDGQFGYVSDSGFISKTPTSAYVPNHDVCKQLLDLLTNHSLYTLEEELRRGFITVRGGHRIGLAGRTILDKGNVMQIREISSFNIRVAREVRGISRPILPYLLDRDANRLHHTLVISPPQQGKTTFIRDLARSISYGDKSLPDTHVPAMKVGIIDERSEIAACYRGVPTFDVGPRTDVMDRCPKAEGMMMMIRSMSPEVIVVDEIGREEDAHAIHEALYAGIQVIATVHGHHIQDVKNRPILKQLLSEGIFSRFVVLKRTGFEGSVMNVYDADGAPVHCIHFNKPRVEYA